MINFLQILIVILLFVRYVAAVGKCVILAVDNDNWRWLAIAVLMVAVPLAVVFAQMDVDSNQNRLCRRGHEEWTSTTTYVSTRKVLVPVTSHSKQWICEEWQ